MRTRFERTVFSFDISHTHLWYSDQTPLKENTQWWSLTNFLANDFFDMFAQQLWPRLFFLQRSPADPTQSDRVWDYRINPTAQTTLCWCPLSHSRVIPNALDAALESKFTARLRTGSTIHNLLLIRYFVSALQWLNSSRAIPCPLLNMCYCDYHWGLLSVCVCVCSGWWSPPALQTQLLWIYVRQVPACLAPSRLFTISRYSMRSSCVAAGSCSTV